MIDFEEIGRLNYRDPEGLARLDSLLSEVAGFAETRSAAELAQLLETKITAAPDLAPVLGPAIAKFRALALPLLTDEQVLEVMQHLAAIASDERIGLYERLRARITVLPPARRSTFMQLLLRRLQDSSEPIGAPDQTVGWWMKRCLRGEILDVEACFRLPEFTKLDDAGDHTVRHLIHIATLALPSAATPKPIPQRPLTPIVAAAPVPPANLPIAPVAPATPAPTASTPARPSRPEPMVPLRAPVVGNRGPTVAAVLARLQQSQQQATSEPPAVAHLTPEDHEEIRGHADRIAGYDVGPNVHDALDETIDRLIAKANLALTDENLTRRLRTILASRLRDIRNSRETIELLTRPEKIGGMGVAEAAAESLVAEASAEAAKFHDADAVRNMAETLQQRAAELPKPPKIPPSPPEPVNAPPIRPVSPPPTAAPRPVPPSPIQPAPTPFVRPRAVPVAPPLATASLRPMVADRPTVSDIKGTSRLTGPTEELRQMMLVDYRRLGPDPVSCIRRVYEKIQRLGNESFAKRAEGIRAWRESEVYRLYLALGQESLTSGKGIRDAIVAGQQAGRATLTEQEFNLVADLNKKLRF